MSLVVVGILVIVFLLIVLNTKRWRAIGRGVRQSRRDLEEEIRELKDPGESHR